MNTEAQLASEERPQGGRLLLARAGWVALTLLVLVLSAIAAPRYYTLMLAVCQPGAPCLSFQLALADVQLLQQLGLSPSFLAAYMVGLDAASVLINATLASLIFWRRSENRMALFCAYMLVLFGGATYTGLFDYGLRPLGPAWYWLVGILQLLAQVSVLTFLLLFPSGRFIPRWTRWGVLVAVLLEAHYVFVRDALHSQGDAIDTLGYAALLLSLIGLQVYRYRRVSTPVERQQTKWVVLGFSVAFGGLALVIFTGNIFGFASTPNSQVFHVLIFQPAIYCWLLLLPISIAIAILRSRLYDIDQLINRTLVYGALTTLLGLTYSGTVFLLQTALRPLTGGNNELAIVVSTLVIAGLFLPQRHRIHLTIDRRFYRRKYDAAKTLAAFSSTLRDEVDLPTLSSRLVSVVDEAMQPAHASL